LSNCAVLIPVHRPTLSPSEEFSVFTSLGNLREHDAYWIAPQSMDTSYYLNRFGQGQVIRHPDEFFNDVQGYSRLLVSEDFYRRFCDYEFVLICQTDAIVVKPELRYWLELPYDYIGAPWPSGYSLNLAPKELSVSGGVRCNAFVGNGGLSLRRVRTCIGLIREFSSLSAEWYKFGHAEDLFFAFLGTLSKDFVLPNVATAARFSHDIEPAYLQELIGHELPFGVHAWEKYDRNLWVKKWESLGLVEKLNGPIAQFHDNGFIKSTYED
jgi:hypothetical protein